MIKWVFQKPVMNFILYIQCTAQQNFRYTNSLADAIKSKNLKTDFLDLDNFSEPMLIDQACEAVRSADKSCVFFSIEPAADTKPFIKLATLLADHPEKSLILINGSDERISRLLFSQEGFSYHNLSEKEQIQRLQEFLR